MNKRQVEVVVISDVHLRTYGCHAAELVHYLKSIDLQLLILNGDIIDNAHSKCLESGGRNSYADRLIQILFRLYYRVI